MAERDYKEALDSMEKVEKRIVDNPITDKEILETWWPKAQEPYAPIKKNMKEGNKVDRARSRSPFYRREKTR